MTPQRLRPTLPLLLFVAFALAPLPWNESGKLTSTALAQDSAAIAERNPAPSAQQQRETRELIRSIYRADFEALQTDEQRIALARKLMAEVSKTDAAAEQFALLSEVRDLAAQAGAVETIVQSVDELARRFSIDGPRLKADAIIEAVKATDSPVKKKSLALALLKAADEAVDAEEFDAALEFSKAVAEWGKEWIDFELEELAADFASEVEQRRAIYETIKPALTDLSTIPADAALCTTAGKYLCFLRGDWESGLLFLAAGDDAALRTLAMQERAKPAEVQDQVDLADGWWDIAAAMEPGRIAVGVQARAAEWYVKAAAGTENLTKVKVEKRLERFGSSHPQRLAAIQNRFRVDAKPKDNTPIVPGEVTVERIGTFRGHDITAVVESIAFSRDGSLLITGARGEAVVWDVENLVSLRHFVGNVDWVYGAAFSPDGSKVYTVSHDGTARSWDVRTGRQLSLLHKDVDRMQCVFVSHSGRYVLCSTDSRTYVFSDSGEELWVAEGGRGIMSPDESILVCSTQGSTIRFIDARTRRELQSHRAYDRELRGFAFSSDGTILASSGIDRQGGLKLWDSKTFEPTVISGVPSLVRDLSPDGRLVAANVARSLVIFDVSTGQQLASFPYELGLSVATFSPDGTMLAAALDSSISIFRVHVQPAEGAGGE